MNSNRRCIESTTLSAYIDGELSDVEKGEFERHMEACEPCREMAGKLQHLRKDLKAMRPVAIGFDLTPVLQGKLATGKKRSRMAPPWGPLPLSFAATLTITIGILLGTVLADAPGRANKVPSAMALFDPIPPGGLCVAFDSCYPEKKI